MPKRHRPGASDTSLLRHVEEVVLATSGEDAFEIVFAVASAIVAGRGRARAARPTARGLPSTARVAAGVRAAIAEVAARHPILEIDPMPHVTDELVLRVDALLRRSLSDESHAALDAVFESLVPRVSKADKGQFFTPRHVVDFVVRMLSPRAHEVVLDPACGSGAFLAHARAHGVTSVHGCDVDLRAVRVARLLALARGGDPQNIVRGDGLRTEALPEADVVATNPPFAGRAPNDGFEVGRLVRTPERDVLFLERALRLLRPGGRLGIVLPYNKANGESFSAVRRWLVEQARVLAIVGLPRETFLPHTSQRTFILFAKKRAGPQRFERANENERTMFVVSERAGKDSGGEPILVGGRLDHDLDDVATQLTPFLRTEMFGARAARARGGAS
jgi:type I restriction enzyme M protein